MYVEKCSDCIRLWQELAAATFNHIKIESKLRLAELEGNRQLIVSLSLELDAALCHREFLKQMLKSHEAGHDTAADAQTNGV